MKKKAIRPKDPLTRMALKALQEAVAQVVEEHRRDGRPLAIWRDGKVALVYADDLDKPPKRRRRLSNHGRVE